MDFENYKEGQSMQIPQLFEANDFIYRKNRFETYVKSKDIDLWHIIVDGDYKHTVRNTSTSRDESVPYERQSDEHKKMLSKDNEAKMVLYNALPKKKYERNYVRKFLRALPTKWRPKVTTIEESKDLSTLSLHELIGNLKVYEVVLAKDSELTKSKKEKYKLLALKAKKESSDEETFTLRSEDEEYDMAVKDSKKFFRRRGIFVRQPYDDKKALRKVKDDKKEKGERRCFKFGDPNHFIGDSPKRPQRD
ncbi:hypothetical protein Tco_1501632 [Tanacetum coccineum]